MVSKINFFFFSFCALEATLCLKDDLKSDDTESQTDELVEKEYLNIPPNLKTELMLWDLPIHVVATNPIQASLMMQSESTQILTL